MGCNKGSSKKEVYAMSAYIKRIRVLQPPKQKQKKTNPKGIHYFEFAFILMYVFILVFGFIIINAE
jgi:hypothetical protein